MQERLAQELSDRVPGLAAQVHAATYELTTISAEFEVQDVWHEWGYSSCAHWLSVAAGLDLHTGREVLRVGQALRALPKLSAAFATGEISLDKLRWVTRVATPADEHVWLEIARGTSGTQLIRICREFQKVLCPEDAEKLEALRGLDFAQRVDGLVTVTARLLPEEAEIVAAALEKVQREQPPPEGRDWNQRDADAFVEVFRRELSSTPADDTEPQTRVILHVDETVLSGEFDGGRCRGRFRISAEAARELSCAAEVQHQTERDGVPIDLGRSRRLVSPQLARALRTRDGGCVFPGCGRKKVHSHHIEHWARGGTTNLDNLLSLCSFHHHQLHRGAFGVSGEPGRWRFETGDGMVIGCAPQPARGRPPIATGSPMPALYSPRMQFRFACAVIEDGVAFAHANAAQGP